MPFTAGHPAAVLPFVRRGLPASALVIGSMTPDLTMLVPVAAVIHFAHTSLGLITVDLVLGTGAFALWQALFGPAVVAISPAFLATRLPGDVPRGLAYHLGSGGRVLRVLVAVLIGAATHIAWDSITHDWMWGTQHVPWLEARHGPLLGWEWMLRFSDVAATVIILAWVVHWWRGAPVRAGVDVPPLRTRVLAWSAILCPAVAGFLYGLLTDSLFIGFSRGAALGAVGLVAVAAVWSARRRVAA
ncbi:DUF4184 family protein [Amorphoplanes digitatis]|uniref:DUF4184 family protein n=1 Tax=Actinoplanes digitatis TaxID=1868 RepID=A0A7W7I2D7_9ACTN|nr:DUF4184 family protein [Actinoplanes digitatis]MBB4765135.1 hypothetical protein [Actinoplanes digitatis]BFE74864.1 DUF4184 family protein [Actinoplanes digitatis]GID98070.1 hypothetical protein Adi01nite_74820 [Actinoplanes digitatis]